MHYEGVQRLRRRNVKNYSLVLFGMVTALALLITLHSIVPAGLALVFPNSAPQVIPSLREWQGSTGSFMIVSTSRIVLDPLYAAKLQETARVFQADLFDVTEHPLPVVASSSPDPGDFYLTLKNSDGGIGNEGYRFEVGDVLAIRANTSSGIFYGTRTALQILLHDSARLHIVKGIARDYPKYKERGFM